MISSHMGGFGRERPTHPPEEIGISDLEIDGGRVAFHQRWCVFWREAGPGAHGAWRAHVIVMFRVVGHASACAAPPRSLRRAGPG